MPAAKKGRVTEKINVWLLPDQVEWLKAKGNTSETVRALVTEAMNLDRLAESVKAAGAKKKPAKKR